MKKFLALSAVLSAAPMVAVAHHGHNNQFDSTKEIEVSGIVTELRFVNPHSYVMFDVTNASGEVEPWRCEMRAANVLKRSGWTEDMFVPGTAITVNGIASRLEATGCYVETLALGDQEAIGRYDQLAENHDAVDGERAERTPWGAPNLAGNWAADQQLPDTSSTPSYQGGPAGGMGAPPEGGGGPGGPGGPGAAQAGGTTMSEAGLAAMARLQASGAEFGDTLSCNPRDFFSDWTFDQHTNLIVQEEDKITLKYGFMDTERVIYLDIKEHPKDIEPSFAGHSIGWWQDDVLVVHTIGFAEKLMTRGPTVAGATSAERYHTTERFSVDQDAGTLTRSYVARDSLYWVEGHEETGEQTISLADYPWEPYGCEDLTVQ